MPLRTTTCTALLEGLRDPGEQTLWAEYVGRYRPLIVGYCCNLGLDQADAEDVAQEALLAFADSYRAGAYDAQRGRLRAWLFGIVRNTAARLAAGAPAAAGGPGATRDRADRPARPDPGGRPAGVWISH